MSPEPVDANSLFRDIRNTFKALVDNIDHALASVPADEQGGEERQKLLRAREAAERGAELAARQLRAEH